MSRHEPDWLVPSLAEVAFDPSATGQWRSEATTALRGFRKRFSVKSFDSLVLARVVELLKGDAGSKEVAWREQWAK